MSQRFALLVPVKTLSRAKSRLDLAPGGERGALMRAFALDAITAAERSHRVDQVYVVTDEPGFEVAGAVRLSDEGEGALNLALHRASLRVRSRNPRVGLAAMCADLPCLRPEDLDGALGARDSSRWFVSDACGRGTTLLAAAPGTDLDPQFGPDSAHRHEQSGAPAVRAELHSLRLDVDTGADLATARRLGLGPHTTAALEAGHRPA